LLYEIRILPRGIRLTFSGYNDKLKDFATFVTRKLASDLQTKDVDFQKYVDLLNRTLTSFDVNQPYAHASYYAQLAIQPRKFTYENRKLRDALERITLSDLISYEKVLFASGKAECLIQGNYEEAEALDLVSGLDDVLRFKAIARSDIPSRLELLPLPTSDSTSNMPRLLIAEPNPANANSASYIMLQNILKDPKEHVLVELLHTAVIDERFYDDLRTKKQLGYIVASGVKSIADTRSISFIVQSSILPSTALTAEILGFLQGVENQIKQLSNADLASLVKSLIRARVEPLKEISTEVTRNWAEISSGRLRFDRITQEVAALLDLDEKSAKAELLNVWRRMYGSDRRALVTEMIPQNSAAPLPPLSTRYGTIEFSEKDLVLGIDDIDLFRSSREATVLMGTKV
jgi:insulysin